MTAEHWATSACAITPLASAFEPLLEAVQSCPRAVVPSSGAGPSARTVRESQKRGCAMEDEPLYFSKRKPAKCPACGSRRVVRIVYGYPSPDLMQDAESEGSPWAAAACRFDASWQCLECEASIYPETLKGQMPPDLRTFVDEQEWTFAKTMPEWPHEYIVRDRVDESAL